MPRKPLPLRIDGDLFDRVEARRRELGQTRTLFVERALERALVDGARGEPVTVPRAAHETLPVPPRAPAKKTAIALEVRDAVRERNRSKSEAPARGDIPRIAPRHWAP